MVDRPDPKSAGAEVANRVVIVGPCASGKSTLVERLRDIGYDAVVCAQEHSDIPTLWRRARPAAMIALCVDLPTLRERRGANWPEEIWRRQQQRLANAQSAATVVVDTSELSSGDVLAVVARALRTHNVWPESRAIDDTGAASPRS